MDFLSTTVLPSGVVVVVFVLMLTAPLPALAQTETLLYEFCANGSPCLDGANPDSPLTFDTAGNLYGISADGGVYGYLSGAVFELSPNGDGSWDEKVIHSFGNGTDGQACTDGGICSTPLIFDAAGNLYGTTLGGGAYGEGTVFELSPNGAGGWTETILHSFGGPGDPLNPVGGVIMDKAGNLYGVTSQNAQFGNPLWVYELSPSESGWTETLLATISGYTYGGLTMDAAGNLYGVSYTPYLGPGNCVFEVSSNGNGGWNLNVIHQFPEYGSTKDGAGPTGVPAFDKAGNLYGTTYWGGSKNAGTVYRLTPVTKGKKRGTWTEKVLYSFKGGKKDGLNPFSGVVLDAADNIYGTTAYGGVGTESICNYDGSLGCGTVYELTVVSGSYKEKFLFSFNNKDGWLPYGALVLDGLGNLYGTTASGGTQNYGVAFELTP